MSTFIERLKSEPVAVVASVVTVLALVGINVTAEESTVVSNLIVSVTAAIGAIVARSKVTPA